MKKFKKYILTNFLLLGFGITTSVYAAPKQGGSLTVPIITPAFTEISIHSPMEITSRG